jgi:hypothetical protein
MFVFPLFRMEIYDSLEFFPIDDSFSPHENANEMNQLALTSDALIREKVELDKHQ